jgi:2-polyprenyl-3-methyl-5-hydroxy-6-metoxy-1,4-benzoquinol methylase
VHYHVNGVIIKSENAAKPVCQSNKFLIKVIRSVSPRSNVLDYGCGKFRYTIPLSQTVEFVDAIDSSEQILRTQIINGMKTNLVNYAATFLPNVKVHDIYSDEWRAIKFDFVLCSNVLSTVPYKKLRLEILRNIKKVLKDSGVALICVQYRNSYFSGYAEQPNTEQLYDGWLIKGKRGNYFYGLIQPARLKKLCIEAGLEVIDIELNEGTVYITARAKSVNCKEQGAI